MLDPEMSAISASYARCRRVCATGVQTASTDGDEESDERVSASTTAATGQMSPYEREVWRRLVEHWERRSNPRGLPNWASEALNRSTKTVQKVGGKLVDAVPDKISDPIRGAGEAVAEHALRPVVHSAANLLELVDDWAAELTDPANVEKLARKHGLEIGDFSELRQQDLKACDRLLARNALTWRTAGALEGGVMGAVAMIPVPIAGIALSMTADVLVVQVLSVSIASQVAYSYGFDAKDPMEEEFIERLVRRSFAAQAAKAKPLNDVAKATKAIADRQRWSEKLLQDQRIIAALKKLLERVGGEGAKVSVKQVAKVLPFIGVVVGAGVNSAVLGNIAADAQRYCQTRFLCEKYGLPDAVRVTAGRGRLGRGVGSRAAGLNLAPAVTRRLAGESHLVSAGPERHWQRRMTATG